MFRLSDQRMTSHCACPSEIGFRHSHQAPQCSRFCRCSGRVTAFGERSVGDYRLARKSFRIGSIGGIHRTLTPVPQVTTKPYQPAARLPGAVQNQRAECRSLRGLQSRLEPSVPNDRMDLKYQISDLYRSEVRTGQIVPPHGNTHA